MPLFPRILRRRPAAPPPEEPYAGDDEVTDEFDLRVAGTGSEHRPLFIDADTIQTGCPEAVLENEKVIVEDDS